MNRRNIFSVIAGLFCAAIVPTQARARTADEIFDDPWLHLPDGYGHYLHGKLRDGWPDAVFRSLTILPNSTTVYAGIHDGYGGFHFSYKITLDNNVVWQPGNEKWEIHTPPQKKGSSF